MSGVGKFSGDNRPQPKEENKKVKTLGEVKTSSLDDGVSRNERIEMKSTTIGSNSSPKKLYPYRKDVGVKSAGGYNEGEVRTKE